MGGRLWHGWTWALMVLLAACASPEKPVLPVVQPLVFPEAFYLDAMSNTANRVYRVDASDSLLQVRVHRSGPLASFGHDHVVASRDLQGYLLVNSRTGACRADFFAGVDRLTVDEPALRAAAGLDNTLSDGDIEATRGNMLNHVLESERFPFLQARLRRCDPSAHRFEVTLSAHGIERALKLAPLTVRVDDGGVVVTGDLEVRLTDFGMTPFAAFGGLLQVGDALSVSYALAARRVTAQ